MYATPIIYYTILEKAHTKEMYNIQDVSSIVTDKSSAI